MNLYIQMVILFCLPGIYFGKPRGFGTNEKGEDTGFNTEIYSVPEVTPLFDHLSPSPGKSFLNSALWNQKSDRM
jgi:hypothetical protein